MQKTTHIASTTAPLPLPKLTCCKVHKTIQELDREISDYDHVIPINIIAKKLQVDNNELLEHINILHSLYYIKFTERGNGKIRLTNNGRCTVVPE